MKKICNLTMSILFLIICAFFSACGDKFSNLNIKFVSVDGDQLNSIELVLGSEDFNSQKRIGVEFSGIDKDLVGQVQIYSNLSERVAVIDQSYDGNMVYVTVKANVAGSGQLIARHLGSNVSKSIPLKVKQKSNNLTTLNSNYIISIPKEGANEHYLNISSLLKLEPSGSADIVGFKVAPDSDILTSDISPISHDFYGDDLIQGFIVNSSAVSQTITLYPVTKFGEDDSVPYENELINVTFVEILNQENLVIADDVHYPKDEFGNRNYEKTTYLIANDSNYNGMKVQMCFKDENEQALFSSGYEQYYSLEVDCDNPDVMTLITNDEIIIQSSTVTDLTEVKITAYPRNYVGEIVPVTKTIKIKGEVKADTIEAYKVVNSESTLQDVSKNINIYDYFSSGNSLGALFNFKTVSNSGAEVMKGLNGVQIILNPQILYYNNNVFDEDGQPVSSNIGTSKFVLDFHLFSRPLRFTYVEIGSEKYLKSEPLSKSSNLYVKYVETANSYERSLTINVQTVNQTELDYISLDPTTISLKFDRKYGVKSLDVGAGYINNTTVRYYGEDDPIKVDSLYLDLNDNNLKNKIYDYYIFSFFNVMGHLGELTEATLSISVEPTFDLNGRNSLMVKNIDAGAEDPTTLIEEYSIAGDINADKAIRLCYDQNTAVGIYKIVVSQSETGFKKEFLAHVYQSLKEEDVVVDFETSLTAFKKDDYEGNYLLNDEVDYIVASKQQIALNVSLPENVVNSNLVSSYDYNKKLIYYGEGGKQGVPSTILADDYFEFSEEIKNSALMNFKKGTNFAHDGDNIVNYVEIEVAIWVKQYENIITAKEDGKVAITLTFFIYEEIFESDVVLTSSAKLVSPEEFLGSYTYNNSKVKLDVSMDNNLWRYVEKQQQIVDNNIGKEGSYLFTWTIDKVASVETNRQADKEIELNFKERVGFSKYRVEIKGVIKQFNKEITMYSIVDVENPILTERVILQSPVKLRDDSEQTYYLNLKKGEDYTIKAKNYSQHGEVTYGGLIAQIVDKDGRSTQDCVKIREITPNEFKLSVKSVQAGQKVVLFAKDVMISSAGLNMGGFNSPATFLMDGHKKAFVVIDLDLSDGLTEDTAYQIHNADDFWEINSKEEFKESYYKIMTNFDVSNTSYAGTKNIENFKGHFLTYNNNSYTIYGIELTKDNPNLFTGFSGMMKNVIFDVLFNFEGSGNLGVFADNSGTLTNVSVIARGNVKFNEDSIFGALVAVNNGTIKYDSSKVSGANVNLTISGEGKVYLGGLVGNNQGVITGKGGLNATDVNLSGYLANVNLTIENANTVSAFGGVVGFNQGEISSARVSGIIKGGNNVGGVVGMNNLAGKTETKIVVNNNTDNYITQSNLNKAYINNVVSSVKIIEANNNVGGIVGYDVEGSYELCAYQILNGGNDSKIGIEANDNVGGIAGYSENGKFHYCSVMSYWWEYDKLSTTFNDKNPDIIGENFVGGVVGKLNTNTELSYGSDINHFVLGYSSVNAYIKGSETGNIGGLISIESGTAPIHDSYFIGKLEGNIYKNDTYLDSSVIANKNSVVANAIYSVNVTESAGFLDGRKVGDGSYQIKYASTPGNGDPSVLRECWKWINGVNGNHIFIQKDDNAIFEILPQSITVEVKENKINSDDIWLYYHSNGSNNDYEIQTADNIHKIAKDSVEYFAITVLPEFASAGIVASSSNSKVVDFDNSKLVVKGTGYCVLTFASALNSEISTTLNVYVVAPMGEVAVKDKSMADIPEENIPKNSAKEYFIVGSSSEYETNSNIGARVTISIDESKISGHGNLKDYLSISGLSAEETIEAQDDGGKIVLFERKIYDGSSGTYFTLNASTNTLNKVENNTSLTNGDVVYVSDEGELENQYINVTRKLTADVDPDKVFSISALKMFGDDKFTVSVLPYIYATGELTGEESLRIYSASAYQFAIQIKEGATDISLNHSSSLIYPNDNTTITAFVKTDVKLESSDICWVITDENGQVISGTNNPSVNNLCVSNLSVGDVVNGVQMFEYELNIPQSYTIKSKQKIFVTFYVEGKTKIGASVEFVILPQHIDKIEIVNYNNESGDWVIRDILMPASENSTNASRLTINMSPSNGYYDYLEIRDVTGNEEIVFIQVDEGNNAVATNPNEVQINDQLGKGIKLIKQEGQTNVYVLMQIDKDYSTKIHTIQVLAYINGISEPIKVGTKEIDVTMKPIINAVYNLPNGKELEISSTDFDFAVGTEAKFYVTARNTDEFNVKIIEDGTGKYELIENGNFFTLKMKDGEEIDWTNDIEKTVKVEFTASLTKNGETYTDIVSITFKLKEFVIHGVSLTNSKNGQIYGNYGAEIPLNIYFDETDISFYDEDYDSFNDTIYRNENYQGSNPQKEKIYNILQILNSPPGVLTLDQAGLTEKEKEYITLNDGVLKVDENTPDKVVDATKVVVECSDPQIEQTFTLGLTKPSSEVDYLQIKTAEDFNAMISGDNYYQLANDVTLRNYSPIDVEITQFDGNGKTITIESFAPFQDSEIMAGLFKKIYSNMLVKNLTIEYKSTRIDGNWSFGEIKATKNQTEYYDITANEEKAVEYTSARFGGLTPVNEGLVTNCIVKGALALSASALEKTAIDYEIDFNVGALVAKNLKTGYITFCQTSLTIYSQTNIGGFVHTNEGKIASSSNVNGEIYGYNINLENTIEINVAGFVVENVGDISMSYVKFTDSTMSVRDSFAGFVKKNDGKVKDCYVLMEKVGDNNGNFSGFVTLNTAGSISTSYTFINDGEKSADNINMFAPVATPNISDCFEIVQATITYNSRIEGLTTLSKSDRDNQNKFTNFVFGDNSSAVWINKTLESPKLAIETEFENSSKNFKKQNIGSKNNPYLIYDVNTWNKIGTSYLSTGYYRIIADIDFSSYGKNPETSLIDFEGNVQGNNMNIVGIMLYRPQRSESIGLFGTLTGHSSVENSVRNLNLNVSSVWAAKTNAVGILAGISTDFNLFNISIDGLGTVVVGGNAVGGVVGLARGEFNIDKLTSNIGVNSTSESSKVSYAIYLSVLNGKSEGVGNLTNVYYAGSVIGILDAYSNARFNVNGERDTKHYSVVKNISVTGKIVELGNIVGGAFGFVGERVLVDGVQINIEESSIGGSKFAGAVAGENRGIIRNANVVISGDSTFEASESVVGGISGFNLGGLVQNSKVTATLIDLDKSKVAGGIVGRNVNGVLSDVTFEGYLEFNYTGLIIGADYSKDTLTLLTSGSNSLMDECRINTSLIPTQDVKYKNLGEDQGSMNMKVSKETLISAVNNSNKFYSYIENNKLSSSIVANKVLGLCVGLIDDGNFVDNYTFDANQNQFIFNVQKDKVVQNNNYVLVTLRVDKDKLITSSHTEVNSFGVLANVLRGVDVSGINLMYIVGGRVSTIDAWTGGKYTENILIISKEQISASNDPTSPEFSIMVGNGMPEGYEGYDWKINISEIATGSKVKIEDRLEVKDEGVDEFVYSIDSVDVGKELFVTIITPEQTK